MTYVSNHSSLSIALSFENFIETSTKGHCHQVNVTTRRKFVPTAYATNKLEGHGKIKKEQLN